eukprot:Rhum_TRINITY_DN20758_c0_g1::Rhum_TRINITY_DN20758_c0_g1_i1::g.172068::m.172068
MTHIRRRLPQVLSVRHARFPDERQPRHLGHAFDVVHLAVRRVVEDGDAPPRLRLVVAGLVCRARGDVVELALHLLQQRVAVVLAVHAQPQVLHLVVLGLEVDEVLPRVDPVALGNRQQRLLVASPEAGKRVLLVEKLLEEAVIEVEAFLGQRPLVLALHGHDLTPGRTLREEGLHEELRKPVECAVQLRCADGEDEARVLQRGERVQGTAVCRDVALVLAFVRVLLRAEEQHVFGEVRETRHRVGVVELPHLAAHGGGGLLCLAVADGQHLQPVCKRHMLELALGDGGVDYDIRLNHTLRDHDRRAAHAHRPMKYRYCSFY